MEHKQIQHYFFLALLIIVFVANAAIFSPYAGALIFGVTFAVLFRPLYNLFLGVTPRYPSLAAGATMLTIFFALLVPLAALIFMVFQGAQDIYARLVVSPDSFEIVDAISDFFGGQFPLLGELKIFLANFSDYLRVVAGYILKNVGAIFSGAAGMALQMFIALLTVFFVLRDGPHFKKALVRLSPLSDANDDAILVQLERVISAVVKGAVLMAVLQGIAAGLGYLIFSVPHPAFLGGITALTALIPGIGTAIVILPAALFLIFSGKVAAGVGLMIWGFVVVGLLDNFLRPKFIASEVGIHPFLILLAALGGLSIFGVYGFLLGPLAVSLLFALFDLYKKGIAPHTDASVV